MPQADERPVGRGGGQPLVDEADGDVDAGGEGVGEGARRPKYSLRPTPITSLP